MSKQHITKDSSVIGNCNGPSILGQIVFECITTSERVTDYIDEAVKKSEFEKIYYIRKAKYDFQRKGGKRDGCTTEFAALSFETLKPCSGNQVSKTKGAEAGEAI